MHPIFEAITENDFSTFVELITLHPEYLKETHKRYGLLSFAILQEEEKFIDFLLTVMSPQEIAEQKPYHPLCLAFENDSPSLDSILKNPKINLQTLTKGNENFLFYATFYDKKEAIEYLLKNGNNPYQETKNEQSSVTVCIEKNQKEVFNLFSEAPDFFVNYKESWIQKAIKYGNYEVFKKVYPYSNIPIDDLFNMALDFNQIQMISYILSTGEIIPGQSQITRMIDLICKKYENEADREASFSITDFLFSSKIPFNRFVNQKGDNAWALSIENDNAELFEKLIFTNETINITDNQQSTPLFYAIKENNPSFVKKILEKGATINHTDFNGDTPIIAAVKANSIEIVEELLKYPNVDINHVNKNNETALSIAIYYRQIPIVSALIWRGAEITKNPVKFIVDNSVYQIGVNNNYESVFDNYEEKSIDNFIALSQLGFDLNEVNKHGDTLLIHFIKNGYLANFQAMLKCSFDANKVDHQGNSALMCAMEKDNDEYAVSLLWKIRNFRLDLVNNKNENVFDLVKKSQSLNKAHALLHYNEEITLNDLYKILPVFATKGDLQDEYPFIKESKPNLAQFKDPDGHSLLALSILGNNLQNMKWLLHKKYHQLDHKHEKEKIISLIKNLPEKESEQFLKIFKQYTYQKKDLSL